MLREIWIKPVHISKSSQRKQHLSYIQIIVRPIHEEVVYAQLDNDLDPCLGGSTRYKHLTHIRMQNVLGNDL
jgi:hypothetical protein